MHTLLFDPTDVLFFKDGRPMSGASSGHGTSWPLPSSIHSALLASLYRANLQDVHSHAHKAKDPTHSSERKFGSLVHAGPFPVCTNGKAHTWFFPRPLDADFKIDDETEERLLRVILLPVRSHASSASASSLPRPLLYPAGNCVPPSKDAPAAWWSEGAWNGYLETPPRDPDAGRIFVKNQSEFADNEHQYGIAIDPETGSVVSGKFYSAQYLRLRPGWRMGSFANASEGRNPMSTRDLLLEALSATQHTLLLGGQQRTATVEKSMLARLPLPAGKSTGFHERNGKFLVKWILLAPAIWPQINGHSGGWLPTWIDHADGRVLLKKCDLERGPRETREAWRKRVAGQEPIAARLVAAVVGKAVPVTGFALANEAAGRSEGGAKSTHTAVPPGSVYYFEAETAEDAERLATVLNWHGSDTSYSQVHNRRSSVMGEKGFGLGVCGSWDFHPASPAPNAGA